jgi:hypothetical protein
MINWPDPMEIKFDSRTDCVFVTFTGPFSPKGLLQTFYEACDKAVERGSARILLDCSETDGKISIPDRFKVGELAAASSLGRRWKTRPQVAVVCKATMIGDGFGATTASSRGLNAKMFAGVQHALDWLGIR